MNITLGASETYQGQGHIQRSHSLQKRVGQWSVTLAHEMLDYEVNSNGCLACTSGKNDDVIMALTQPCSDLLLVSPQHKLSLFISSH